MDQTVATADTPPVVLGRMPAPFVQSMRPALRHVAPAQSVVCCVSVEQTLQALQTVLAEVLIKPRPWQMLLSPPSSSKLLYNGSGRDNHLQLRDSTCVNCRPGKLLRFEIGPGGIQMHDGQPIGADLKYVGAANQRRGRADACSKVVLNSFVSQALQRPSALYLKHFQ